MMLTQKPTSALRANPMHRRMPSAPPMAVQATRTPGLLVLSPSRSAPRRKSPVTTPPRRSQGTFVPTADEAPAFPICDDVSEMGSPRVLTKDLPPVNAPNKSKLRKAKQARPGLITMPSNLTSPNTPKRTDKRAREPTPSPRKKPAKRERRHKRAPSEGADGVFQMSGASSAEESDPEGALDLRNIFASVSTPSTPTRPSPVRAVTAVTTPKATPRPRPASTSLLIGLSSSAPLPGLAARAANRHSDQPFSFAGSLFQSAPQTDALPCAALL